MKVAICKDNTVTYDSYEAYRYSWWFRLFGPTVWSLICSSCSEDNLMKSLKRKLYGKIEFIRIVEV